MIYEVRANIFFVKEDKATDFYRDCQVALSKGITVNPSSENAQKSIVELILCNHISNPLVIRSSVATAESD